MPVEVNITTVVFAQPWLAGIVIVLDAIEDTAHIPVVIKQVPDVLPLKAMTLPFCVAERVIAPVVFVKM